MGGEPGKRSERGGWSGAADSSPHVCMREADAPGGAGGAPGGSTLLPPPPPSSHMREMPPSSTTSGEKGGEGTPSPGAGWRVAVRRNHAPSPPSSCAPPSAAPRAPFTPGSPSSPGPSTATLFLSVLPLASVCRLRSTMHICGKRSSRERCGTCAVSGGRRKSRSGEPGSLASSRSSSAQTFSAVLFVRVCRMSLSSASISRHALSGERGRRSSLTEIPVSGETFPGRPLRNEGDSISGVGVPGACKSSRSARCASLSPTSIATRLDSSSDSALPHRCTLLRKLS
ncbi:hypothetical protein T484DRAFT_1929064 [Baffinella frigidus]|nr:hypothetical protein T484DRAFT_1929064 [Cryptophyta sp. CCMP2293]